MTDEQINEAIAVVFGYEFQGDFPHTPDESVKPPKGPLIRFDKLPDYCNDPNAMREVETWLMNIDPQSWDEYYCSFEKSLCCSTERQRAENFLKVIGKWKE